MIAGVIARAAFDYRAKLLVATHQGDIDRYERTLADNARRELEVAAADRRDFLRVVTHELRTPITSIAALARALDGRGDTIAAAERAEASRVFEKGFSFGRHRDSSGLGLWIVSELVDALGGTIQALPRPGGGLTMRVTLPNHSPS